MLSLRNIIIRFACGALIGLVVAYTLIAIATPAYTNYHVLHSFLEQLKLSTGIVESLNWLEGNYVAVLIVLALGVVWLSVVRELNPQLPTFPYLKSRHKILTWLLVVAAGVVFWVGIVIMLRKQGFYSGHTRLGPAIMGILLCGLAWWLISPQGLAGNFTFPIKITRQQLRPYLKTVLFGMAAATVLFGLTYLLNIFVEMLFFSTEFLDRSMEIDSRSFIRFFYFLPLLGGLALVLGFGLLPAFRADQLTFKARLRASRPALVLLAIILVAFAAFTPRWIGTHHFTKKSLSEVVKFEPASVPARKLIVMGTDHRLSKRYKSRRLSRPKSMRPLKDIAIIFIKRHLS